MVGCVKAPQLLHRGKYKPLIHATPFEILREGVRLTNTSCERSERRVETFLLLFLQHCLHSLPSLAAMLPPVPSCHSSSPAGVTHPDFPLFFSQFSIFSLARASSSVVVWQVVAPLRQKIVTGTLWGRYVKAKHSSALLSIAS